MRSRGIRNSAARVLCSDGVELKSFEGYPSLGIQEFRRSQVVPGAYLRQRSMIGHVALQRRYRDVTVFNGAVVGTVFRIGTKVLLANPKIGFATRIDVFGDHGSRVFYPLPRHLHSLYFTLGNVHVQ